ncbi:oligosaccharide flippase family protein [Myroides sp. TSA_177.3]|uniref:oligosaccharide flippase family protein n=1 Tax=Myroides sp. TSA_177.3 TaxID=3415650 RepID=UPI0040466BA1
MKKVRSIFKSDFVRHVSILMSGTAIAQLCSFAFIPVISRFYTEEAFGVFASYMAVVSLLSSFVTLKYDTALILPKDDNEAYALLKLSNIVSLFLIILFSVILFLPIAFFDTYRELKWLLALGTILSVNFNNSALLNIRFKQFKITSLAKIIQVIAVFVFQVICFYYYEIEGLMYGNILGVLVSNCYMVLNRKLEWKVYRNISYMEMRTVAIRYKDFPMFFTLSNMISSLNSNLPVLFFARFFSLVQVGIYGMALKVITQPVTLIAESFKSVILSHMNNKKNEDLLILKWYMKVVVFLLLIAIVGCIFLYLFGDSLIILFLGKKWIGVSLYIKLMIPLFVSLMIATPSTAAVRVFEMQRYSLFFAVVSLVITLIFFSVFYLLKFDLEKIVLYNSFLYFIMVLFNHAFIIKRIYNYDKDVYKKSI